MRVLRWNFIGDQLDDIAFFDSVVSEGLVGVEDEASVE
jgi:hypothetical protein